MKDIRVFDIVQTGFLILSMLLAGWYLKSDITKEIKYEMHGLEKRFDKRFEQIDKRFDRIELRLDRIEKNHLDHIITFHSLKIKPEDKK